MDGVYNRETLRGYLYCNFTQGQGEVQAHKSLTDAAGEEALTLEQVREIYAEFRKNPKKIKKEMRDSIKAAGGLSLEYVKDFYKKCENGEWTLKVGQGTEFNMDTYMAGHVKAYHHDGLTPQQTLDKLRKIYPGTGLTLSEIEKEYASIVNGTSKFVAKEEKEFVGEEPSPKMLLAFEHRVLDFLGTDLRLSLRKVCRAFRDMVDNHPHRFPVLDLLVSNTVVEIKNNSYRGHYLTVPEGCMISSLKDSVKQCKHDRDGNMWDAAGSDLKALLNNPNTKISNFNVLKGFSKSQYQYTMWLTRILENAQPIVHKPKVKTLSIDFSDKEAFELILDLLNPEQLEAIEITNAQSDIGLHFPELGYLKPILEKNFVNVKTFVSDLRFQKQDLMDVLHQFDFAKCATSEEIDLDDVLQITEIMKNMHNLDEVTIETPAVDPEINIYFMGIFAFLNMASTDFHITYPDSEERIHMRFLPQKIMFRGPRYVERNPEVTVSERAVYECSCDHQ